MSFELVLLYENMYVGSEIKVLIEKLFGFCEVLFCDFDEGSDGIFDDDDENLYVSLDEDYIYFEYD